jgi:hypothetical protein
MNLDIVRGDDEVLDFAFQDEDGGPLDLSGAYQVWFTAKHSLMDEDEDAVILKTLGDGVEIVSELEGVGTIEISGSDTAGLPSKATLKFDVQLLDSTEKTKTLISGNLRVSPDVTRSIE